MGQRAMGGWRSVAVWLWMAMLAATLPSAGAHAAPAKARPAPHAARGRAAARPVAVQIRHVLNATDDKVELVSEPVARSGASRIVWVHILLRNPRDGEDAVIISYKVEMDCRRRQMRRLSLAYFDEDQIPLGSIVQPQPWVATSDHASSGAVEKMTCSGVYPKDGIIPRGTLGDLRTRYFAGIDAEWQPPPTKVVAPAAMTAPRRVAFADHWSVITIVQPVERDGSMVTAWAETVSITPELGDKTRAVYVSRHIGIDCDQPRYFVTHLILRDANADLISDEAPDTPWASIEPGGPIEKMRAAMCLSKYADDGAHTEDIRTVRARLAGGEPALGLLSARQLADPSRTWRIVRRSRTSLILLDPASGTQDGGYRQARVAVITRDPGSVPGGWPYAVLKWESDCPAGRGHSLQSESLGDDLFTRRSDTKAGDWTYSDPASAAGVTTAAVCDLAAGRPAEMISGTLSELRADYVRDFKD